MKRLMSINLWQKSVWLSAALLTLSVNAEAPVDVKFNGNIMLDYDNFDAIFLERSDDSQSEFELRRLRLGVDVDFFSDWNAELKVDVSDGIEIKEAVISYSGWQLADFTLGKQKEPFGLERLMSSKNLLMIERSMISGAISPDRSHGIKAAGGDKAFTWQLGYFQDDNHEKSQALTARVTWAPWNNDNNLVHIGSAFSERNLRGAAFRINQALEVHGADSLIEGDKFDADSASLNSLEFIWQHNGFLTMAEWQQASVSADDGNDYQYDGGYYQVAYLFSGEKRKYKNGVLGKLNTKNDWEISLRYSQLNLHKEDTQAKTLALGLNYYFDKDLKVMADYIKADYSDEDSDLSSGNAVSLRVQYSF